MNKQMEMLQDLVRGQAEKEAKWDSDPMKLTRLTEADDIESYLTTFERMVKVYEVNTTRWAKGSLSVLGVPVGLGWRSSSASCATSVIVFGFRSFTHIRTSSGRVASNCSLITPSFTSSMVVQSFNHLPTRSVSPVATSVGVCPYISEATAPLTVHFVVYIVAPQDCSLHGSIALCVTWLKVSLL